MRTATVVILAILVLLAATASGQNLLATEPFGTDLNVLDLSGNVVATTTLTEATGLSSVQCLAEDPTTGTIYLAGVFGVNFSGSARSLGVLGPIVPGGATTVTEIGDLGDQVAGLTFASDGTLFALTGDGGSASETLFTVDTATGAMTMLMALGNGDDGEALAYNPLDGLIYHTSGIGTGGVVYESVDPGSGTIVNIPLAPSSDEEILGMAFDPTGLCYLIDRGSDLRTLTTSGTNTLIASVPYLRGLAYVDTVQYAGTPDLLGTLVSVNGTAPAGVGYGGDGVGLTAGDNITVNHFSANGNLVFVGDFLVIGTLTLTANAAMIPEPFPGIHIDPASAFFISQATVNGMPLQLPPTGFGFGFSYGGGLAGTSVLIQGFVLTTAAVNGIFASTHGLLIDFL